MSDFDYLSLDGNTLRTFLTVLEEASVSKAAIRLGVSQSAISHTLEKLRLILGDPLFVRKGRGINPTAKALALREPVDAIVGHLKSLTYNQKFNPLIEAIELTIAANDFPLRFIFPTLLRELYAKGIYPNLAFIPSGVPSVNNKRACRSDMFITPALPREKEYRYTQLFESEAACFYDSSIRKAPETRKQLTNSKYVEVKFSDNESSQMVYSSINTLVSEERTISVPNFSALSDFIKGTELMTIQSSLFSRGLLKDLDSAPLPIETESVPVYLVWHKRDQNDPANCWFRNEIIRTVELLSANENNGDIISAAT